MHSDSMRPAAKHGSNSQVDIVACQLVNWIVITHTQGIIILTVACMGNVLGNGSQTGLELRCADRRLKCLWSHKEQLTN